MAKPNWTKNQLLAINSRNGSILVSAAAGSGKTAVLVQRVIESLTDKKNPIDADKLLVVTFTNAAACEMKERINRKIAELILENPTDKNLKRQQILLKNAKISTVHSFCNDLICENFYKLNISPDFKIADSAEIELLKKQAIADVFEKKYNESSPSFFNLVETFSLGRDDSKLIEIINLLYDFIRSHPFPKSWLNEKLNMYDTTLCVKKTVFGKFLIKYAKDVIEHCLALYGDALNLINEEDAFIKAYKPSFDNDYLALEKIKNILSAATWDEISTEICQFKASTLKRVTGFSDDPLKLKIMSKRDTVKSILKELSELFFIKESDYKNDTEKIRAIAAELFSLVMEFSSTLDNLKLNKNLVDFGDLEHLALKLLVKESNNGFIKTDDAVELSKKFSQIIVDECQDTNEAQDMIFRAISNDESNLFMVGDVKQSIYRFRQAMPEIFLKRKESYQSYNEHDDEYPAKIILDKNFRSRKGVLDTVNFMFTQLMSKSLGEMEYTNEEALVAGATFFEKDTPDTELKIIDLTESDEKDIDIVEARYISKIIAKMITEKYQIQDKNGTRPVTYGDFCILLRNANKHAKIFVKEMQKCSVPALCDSAETLFSSGEIKIIVALLKSINDPTDDIAILSVFLSPIGNGTLDDIVSIRKNKNIPIYFEMQSADQNNKISEFLKMLKKYSIHSKLMPLSKFINYLYDDTSYINTVSTTPNAETKINNLHTFLEFTENFEKSNCNDFYKFVDFINDLSQQNIDINVPQPSTPNTNAVKIMSIHRSKGLEFPVCILANCSRHFNKDQDDILLHPSLGIGIKLLDKENFFRYTTLQRDTVKLSLENSSLSEELRVLYVALTRAREKLIIITSIKEPQKVLTKLGLNLTTKKAIAPYSVQKANSFSDWILSCALRHKSGGQLRTLADVPPEVVVPDNNLWDIKIIKPEPVTDENLQSEMKLPVQYDNALLNEITDKINASSKLNYLSNIPREITVTELALKDSINKNAFSKKPKFIKSESEVEPTFVGTTLHILLQHLNFAKAKNNLLNEIDALIKQSILTNEQVKTLDVKKIENFLQSDLADRIIKSNKVFKEYQFNIKVNANQYDKSLPENANQLEIILNGTIDCMFFENDEIVLVDYKTTKFFSTETLCEYKKQLDLYKKAITDITAKKVKQCILYAFNTNEQILL